MKHILCTALFCLSLAATVPAGAQTLTPQLAATIGSGINESFFVLDFEDSTATQSYAFGYRYTEPASGPQITGANMVEDLAAANIGLGVTYYHKYAPADHNPLGIAPMGFSFMGHDQSGFLNNGYWGYWTSPDGQNWTASQIGASTRTLFNGSYDGWAWDAGTSPQPVTPLAVSAVPEAGAGWLLLLGLPLAIAARRRVRA